MASIQGNGFFYDNYLLLLYRGGTFLPESDALKVGLLLDTYSPNLAHTVLGDVSPFEVAGNGYSRQDAQNVAVSKDPNGFIRLDFDQCVFTAVGGLLAFKYWFLFDDTTPQDYLMAFGEVDSLRQASSTGVVTLLDTKTFTFVPNELGFHRSPTSVLS